MFIDVPVKIYHKEFDSVSCYVNKNNKCPFFKNASTGQYPYCNLYSIIEDKRILLNRCKKIGFSKYEPLNICLAQYLDGIKLTNAQKYLLGKFYANMGTVLLYTDHLSHDKQVINRLCKLNILYYSKNHCDTKIYITDLGYTYIKNLKLINDASFRKGIKLLIT